MVEWSKVIKSKSSASSMVTKHWQSSVTPLSMSKMREDGRDITLSHPQPSFWVRSLFPILMAHKIISNKFVPLERKKSEIPIRELCRLQNLRIHISCLVGWVCGRFLKLTSFWSRIRFKLAGLELYLIKVEIQKYLYLI